MNKVEQLEKKMEASLKRMEENLEKIKELEGIMEKTQKEEKGE